MTGGDLIWSITGLFLIVWSIVGFLVNRYLKRRFTDAGRLTHALTAVLAGLAGWGLMLPSAMLGIFLYLPLADHLGFANQDPSGAGGIAVGMLSGPMALIAVILFVSVPAIWRAAKGRP